MSGRGHGRGRGGGRQSHQARGQGPGGSQNSRTDNKNQKELCVAIGNHVFDYHKKKGAADQLTDTWDKLVDHAGSLYGENVRNELFNKAHVVLKPPGHTQAVLAKHQVRETAKRKSLQILLNGQLISAEKYEEIAAVGINPNALVKLAILQNDIQQTQNSLANPLPMKLDEQDKSEFDGHSKAYHRRVEDIKSKLLGKVFSLIMGQCTQLLKDQMKHDPDWLTVCKSIDPLTLYTLIEKTVLSQSDDCYKYATTYARVYDLYKHTQAEGNLTNDKWYHQFNTKVDVGIAVGVTHQYPKLLDLEAKKLHNKEFALLDPITEQLGICEIAEERYLAYVFLQQSGSQHDQLRTALLNDFS